MPPIYAHRTALKQALGIASSATNRNAELDTVAEAVSRLFDERVGFSFGPSSQTRDYTAKETTRLYLDTPLLALDALRTSSDNGSSFDTTLATTQYWLTPYNASMEGPRRPYWGLELRSSATGFLPTNSRRGVRLVGTWGYYDERSTSPATPATTLTSNAATALEWNNVTALHVGQTIILGGERMRVTRSPGSSTGAITSTIDVLRAQDGTSGATHSSATGVEYYTYPIVDRLALQQAQFDWRAQDAPLGFTGGGLEGANQRPVVSAGLHPFVQRRLDSAFRTPRVG